MMPPGTLLQLLYLRERLQNVTPGRFIEIGPGHGDVTSLLLELGWHGQFFELDAITVSKLKERFSTEISEGRLIVNLGDFLDSAVVSNADLIISCMVIEHFPREKEALFMEKAATHLNTGGRMIAFVPASPLHWGIEDEVAGHQRRYTRDLFSSLAAAHGWQVSHTAGLTFPLSNFLLPLSNYLVFRQERKLLRFSDEERTMMSGRRDVIFKTNIPFLFRYLMSKKIISFFHWLQKKFLNHKNALVLYVEAYPQRPSSHE